MYHLTVQHNRHVPKAAGSTTDRWCGVVVKDRGQREDPTAGRIVMSEADQCARSMTSYIPCFNECSSSFSLYSIYEVGAPIFFLSRYCTCKHEVPRVWPTHSFVRLT